MAAARLQRRLDPLVGERRRQPDIADGKVRPVAGDVAEPGARPRGGQPVPQRPLAGGDQPAELGDDGLS